MRDTDEAGKVKDKKIASRFFEVCWKIIVSQEYYLR